MSARKKSGCAVVGCDTNTTTSSRKVKFFSFPYNPEMRQIWIDACNNPKVNPKNSVICDLHFQNEDYKSANLLLTAMAVPKTILVDPLATFADCSGDLKKPTVEFIDVSGCNENIEKMSNHNTRLYKDSSIQCNLFEEIFNEEFENYSSDLKFSVDEIAKKLGIKRKIELQENLELNLESTSNEPFELLSNYYDSELESEKNEDDFPSETNNDIIYKSRRLIRDRSKQNFILLPDGSYQCEICYKKCLNLAAYYAHHDSHLEHSTICTKCGLNSLTYKRAKHHEKVCTGLIAKKQKDNSIAKSYSEIYGDKTCEICNFKFVKYFTYMDHMNVHNQIKPYTCSCSRKYSHYSNFQQHVTKLKCPIDGRILPDYAPQGLSSKPIEIKKKDVESINSKLFYCPVCDKHCYRRTCLKHFAEYEHLKNEKLWIEKFHITKIICIFCNRSMIFDKLLDCINHCRKVHHKIPYNKISQLLENKSKQHENKNSSENIEQDSSNHKILINCSQIPSNQKYCSKCDKHFVKRITFLDHMNIHDNTYPYKCSCGIQLRFYQEFLKHIRQNQCKGKIIFPDYAPQTFSNQYNPKNDIDHAKLENDIEINSNVGKNIVSDNFELLLENILDYMEID